MSERHWNNPIDLSVRHDIERVISGAIRSTIQVHGAIGNGFVSSATKRVFGALKTHARNVRRQPGPLRRALQERSHFGCDPMCDHCYEWLEGISRATRPVVVIALEAFWSAVEHELGECRDLGPPSSKDELGNLIDAASESVTLWAAERMTAQKGEKI